MKVSSELLGLNALPKVLSEQEAGWVPKLSWILEKKQSLAPARNLTTNPFLWDPQQVTTPTPPSNCRKH